MRPYCEGTFISFEETAPTADEMARRIASIGATRPWIVLESACGPSASGVGPREQKMMERSSDMHMPRRTTSVRRIAGR